MKISFQRRGENETREIKIFLAQLAIAFEELFTFMFLHINSE